MGTWKKGGDRTERLFLWLAGPSRDRTPPRAVCLPLISQLTLTRLDAMRPSRIEYAGALGARSGADESASRSYAKTRSCSHVLMARWSVQCVRVTPL